MNDHGSDRHHLHVASQRITYPIQIWIIFFDAQCMARRQEANKEYTQAVTAFEAFMIDHPKSTYIANSYYWLGQLLHKEQKLTEARAAFMTVVEKHATSNKYPDALYKVGFIDEVLGKIPSAKSFYTRVVSEFPNGSAAGLAKKRLANL